MNTARRVFITGANRGLGKELVKMVHQKNPELQMHLTSRSKSTQFASELQSMLPSNSFKCYQLDLNNGSSIRQLAEKLKHQEIKFDFIVANAAYGADYGQKMPSYQIANNTLKTNFEATVDFIKQFLPLLANEGRVVIVSSIMGALSEQKQSIRNKLQDSQITEQQLLKMSSDYISAAKEQKMGDFNFSAYRTSKALINTWARFILPKCLKYNQTAVTMHPGWCKTDMGGSYAPLTPEQGAKRIHESMWVKEVQVGRFYNGKFCDFVTCQ